MKIVYAHTCQDCDWQVDPSARAGVETQIARHQKETLHVVVTRGVPKGTS